MARILQLRRGSAADHATFTGAVGEITYDTTDKRLVGHDGTTAGGIPFAKESEISGAATTSASGLVELATDAEAIAKTDTDRAVTPSNLAALDSSATFKGLVELATSAEAQTGTDTARAVTPAGLRAAALDILLHVREQQTSGTSGGTFTSGADRTRVINTTVVNQITGASLGSNQITLPAGTYRIIASAPGFLVDGHQTLLYNVTDASEVCRGTTENSIVTGGVGGQTRSWINYYFTIAGTKAFEIRHRCATTRATNGLGPASSFGTEVYTDVMIWKVA